MSNENGVEKVEKADILHLRRNRDAKESVDRYQLYQPEMCLKALKLLSLMKMKVMLTIENGAGRIDKFYT